MSEKRFQRIERQLEFLSENQAQLTISMAKHDDFIGRLARVLEEHARQTHERFARTDEQIRKLVQAQSQTEKRLKAHSGNRTPLRQRPALRLLPCKA